MSTAKNGPIDAETLPGVSFHDERSRREMRFIYPDAKHWAAGWIVVRNRIVEWMTLRHATEQDVAAITRAVVEAHHS